MKEPKRFFLSCKATVLSGMPGGMETHLTSGVHHERTRALYAWGLSWRNGNGRNRLNLCGAQSPAAAAQACPAVGDALRSNDQTVGCSGQKHRWSTGLTLGRVTVGTVSGLDVRQASARPRDGSVSRRECRGARVYWPPRRSQAADSGSFQY